MKLLSIIILNYNTRDYTLRCLQSLTEQTLDFNKDRIEVFVVDNGSTDGSVEAIQNKFSWVIIIRNRENIGFARANNKAIKKSKGRFILLLNSDTITTEDTLEKMINFLKQKKQVGAATARLELTDGSLDLACHRGFPTPFNAFTYFVGLEQLFPNSRWFSGYHQTWKDFNKPHEVDAISGACFFIRKKVIDEIGLLDERFFMYAEDLDWCMRIKKAGWKIYYNPEATIIHHKKRSGRKRDKQEENAREIRAQSLGHFYETMKLFYDKHYKNKYPKWLRKTVLFGIWLFTKIKLTHNRIL